MSGGGGKSGGGGGSPEIPTNTTTTTKWSPPDYLGGKYGGLNSYMSYAAQVLGKPYQSYDGQTQAGPTSDQQMGWQLARQRALGGNKLAANSDQMFKDTLAGKYTPQGMSQNKYQGAQTQVGQNQYLGMNNPYLQSAIDYSMGDISRNYNQNVAPQLDRAFSRSNAFGGSAYQQQLGETQRQLAGELGRASTGMRMQDYGQQQQLAENDINRRAQYQNNDISRNASLYQQNLDSYTNRQEAERNRQIGMMDYADRAGQRDFNDAQQLMNIGQQQGGYLQNYLGQGQQDFNNANNFLTNNMNQFGNVYGSLSGQGNSSQTSTNPNGGMGGGSNPLAMGLGAAQTGMGLYGMGKNLGFWGAGAGAAGGLSGGITGIASGAFGDPFSGFLI